ncbi:MAG: hypothetical protein HC869_27180 [Rhodospirillales bacterium]|nr:hypothetical protein [Rhodospirillales bacterium]
MPNADPDRQLLGESEADECQLGGPMHCGHPALSEAKQPIIRTVSRQGYVFENTLRLMAVALESLRRTEEARRKVKEFLAMRPQTTLDDWRRPNSRSHANVAERREQMRAPSTARMPEGRRMRRPSPDLAGCDGKER